MNKHTSTSESIILIDSLTIEGSRKFLEKKTDSLIISFDYTSHVDLAKNNVAHEISDVYSNESELESLQTQAYRLSNWAEEPEVAKFLNYNGFNLGKLFKADLFIYLIPFLKKFHEIQKIAKKYSHANFYCSGQLYQMMKLVNNSVFHLNENIKMVPEFYYDYIKLQNNFLQIKIPRSYYLKLKKFLEWGVHCFFGPRKHIPSNGILLIEFNTIQYAQLFLKSNLNGGQLIFYGRKRPAFWDLSSFSIIKKSKCLVVTPHALINNKIKKIISNDTIKINENAELLYQQDNFFTSFFSLNDVSFWVIMKPFFVDLCSRRFRESISETQFANILLNKLKPKCVMVLSESGYTEQFVIHEAKRLGIPVVLHQHGLSSFDSPKSDEMNKFTGSVPFFSDVFLVWGNAMKRYSEHLEISDEKIKVLGSPSHDKTFKIAKNSKLSNDFILVSSGSTTHNHINDYTVKANEEYVNALRTICKTVTQANKKLVIKMHPYMDDQIERTIAKEISSSITILRKGNMLSLVQACELLITLHVTSAILDAQILSKPVLRIPLGEWWGQPNFFRPSPGLTVTAEEFGDVFHKVTHDHNLYQTIVDDGKKFVNECLVNHGVASQKICTFIKDAYLQLKA